VHGIKKIISCQILGAIHKGNIFFVHAMKPYRWRRGIAPLILNLGTRWR